MFFSFLIVFFVFGFCDCNPASDRQAKFVHEIPSLFVRHSAAVVLVVTYVKAGPELRSLLNVQHAVVMERIGATLFIGVEANFKAEFFGSGFTFLYEQFDRHLLPAQNGGCPILFCG
jgi:hypothetical protein